MGVAEKLPFSRSIELENTGAFQSALLRWFWRIYTQHLTRAGRWFIWPTLFFITFGGFSLQVQGYVGMSYLLGVWAVALAAILIWRPRVRLTA